MCLSGISDSINRCLADDSELYDWFTNSYLSVSAPPFKEVDAQARILLDQKNIRFIPGHAATSREELLWCIFHTTFSQDPEGMLKQYSSLVPKKNWITRYGYMPLEVCFFSLTLGLFFVCLKLKNHLAMWIFVKSYILLQSLVSRSITLLYSVHPLAPKAFISTVDGLKIVLNFLALASFCCTSIYYISTLCVGNRFQNNLRWSTAVHVMYTLIRYIPVPIEQSFFFGRRLLIQTWYESRINLAVSRVLVEYSYFGIVRKEKKEFEEKLYAQYCTFLENSLQRRGE